MRRRRRRHPAKRPPRTLLIAGLSSVVILTLLLGTAVAMWRTSPSSRVTADNRNDGGRADHAVMRDGDPLLQEVSDESETSAARPNYRYSVIPGGVESGEELALAIRRDEPVAVHYQTVSLDRVRVERVATDRRAYVSYRIGDQIYWTRHQVTIPAGEQILTDGVTQIRARCGNGIAFEPQLPTLDQEPDNAEFEALAPAGLLPSYRMMPALSAALMDTGDLATGERLPGVGLPGVGLPGLGVPGLIGAVPLLPVTPVSSRPELFLSDGLDPALIFSERLDPGLLPAVFPESIPGDSLQNPGGGIDLSPTPALNPAPIPEPSSMILLGTGLAGACWRRLRSRQR